MKGGPLFPNVTESTGRCRAYPDGGGARQSDDFVGSVHHVYKATIVVVKPAAVHDGGDDIGCGVVGQAGRVEWFPCGVDTRAA